MELSKLCLDTDLLRISSIHLYLGKPGKPTLTSTTAKGRLSEGWGKLTNAQSSGTSGFRAPPGILAAGICDSPSGMLSWVTTASRPPPIPLV